MKILETILMMWLMMLLGIPGFVSAEASIRSLDQQLIEAAARNDVTGIQRLLEQGAALHAHDGRGRTALLTAVDGNHVESAKLLIEAGSDVNVQDHQLDNPLLLAGARGYLEIIKLTLQANPRFYNIQPILENGFNSGI